MKRVGEGLHGRFNHSDGQRRMPVTRQGKRHGNSDRKVHQAVCECLDELARHDISFHTN